MYYSRERELGYELRLGLGIERGTEEPHSIRNNASSSSSGSGGFSSSSSSSSDSKLELDATCSNIVISVVEENGHKGVNHLDDPVDLTPLISTETSETNETNTNEKDKDKVGNIFMGPILSHAFSSTYLMNFMPIFMSHYRKLLWSLI